MSLQERRVQSTQSVKQSGPRSGGRILVDQLLVHGAEMAFCVPGESYLEVLDALYDVRDRLTLINARHEAGAANMAEAYAKLTGKPGIAMVTRGPGACHAAVGVHTAFQDSTPMILLVGQVGRGMMDREAFQEIDYRQMFGPVAKWVAEIDDHRAHSRICRARLSSGHFRAARAGGAVAARGHARPRPPRSWTPNPMYARSRRRRRSTLRNCGKFSRAPSGRFSSWAASAGATRPAARSWLSPRRAGCPRPARSAARMCSTIARTASSAT